MNQPTDVKQALQALSQTIKPTLTPQTGAGLVPTQTTTTTATPQAPSPAPQQPV